MTNEKFASMLAIIKTCAFGKIVILSFLEKDRALNAISITKCGNMALFYLHQGDAVTNKGV